MKSRILFLIAASLLYGANLSYGYAVAVDNPSFQSPSVGNQGGETGLITGWTQGGDVGVLRLEDVADSAYILDGNQVAFVKGTGSFSQLLTERLKDGYTYTLVVSVGRRNTGTPFSGGVIQLWGSSGLLGEIQVSEANSNAPAAGTWVEKQLVFTATGSTPGLGDRLKITFAGLTDNASYQTNFDKLSLTAVPLPAAAWLFGSALLGLGWTKRFRRQSQDALIA